jgi:hypothetical protein
MEDEVVGEIMSQTYAELLEEGGYGRDDGLPLMSARSVFILANRSSPHEIYLLPSPDLLPISHSALSAVNCSAIVPY